MSLSPLVSFKSRFVTYLLNFPRIMCFSVVIPTFTLNLMFMHCFISKFLTTKKITVHKPQPRRLVSA